MNQLSMILYRPNQSGKKLARIDRMTLWFTRIAVVLMILGMVMSNPNPAFADEDPPGMGGIVNVFEKLGEMFINIAYSLMIIVFAVGTVKSGLAAQAAQQFGASGRVSIEVMNIAGGVIIFVLGMLSLPIVKWILAELGDFVLTNVSLSDYISVE